jgi:hypothetical protein
MGIIKVALEDERGKSLEEVEGHVRLLGQYLPSLGDERFQCLRFIDSYGDTVFNRPQMERFIIEWQKIMANPKTQEESILLSQVLYLAKKCLDEPHRYLKFYGD